MKFQLLVVAACLCAASAGVPKKLVKKYAMKKVMESCLGKEVVANIKQEVMAACNKCHGKPGPQLPQLRSQLMTMMGASEPVHSASYRQAVQYVPVPAAFQFQPVPYQYQRRWKRGAHQFSAEKLEKIKEKMSAIIGNMTCVMKEMKLLDANNQVDFPSLKKRIMELPLEKPLVDDLCDGVDKCRDFSSCIPSSVFEKSPVMAGFGKQIAFFKCFKMAKVESCMKQDFREEYYPMLLRDGLAMNEEESFQTIISSAILEEAGEF